MKPFVFVVLALAACAGSAHQKELIDARTGRPGQSIVQVLAGESETGPVYYYLVDKRIEACWFATSRFSSSVFQTVAPIDCCKLRKVPDLVAEVGFATCP